MMSYLFFPDTYLVGIVDIPLFFEDYLKHCRIHTLNILIDLLHLHIDPSYTIGSTLILVPWHKNLLDIRCKKRFLAHRCRKSTLILIQQVIHLDHRCKPLLCFLDIFLLRIEYTLSFLHLWRTTQLCKKYTQIFYFY